MSTSGPIIDTDVHETFTSYQDLVPYLQEPWRWLVESGAWRGISPHYAIWSNAGWRQDAFPEKGSPGSNYELLRQQVLEFQRSHGLVADGVVGNNTLIHLNTSAAREGVPLLQPVAAE